MGTSQKPADYLKQLQNAVRLKNYSLRTEEAYLYWTRKFLNFHQNQSPSEMGAREASAFLTHLAVDLNLAASSQNQALSALLFFFRQVLHQELAWMQNLIWAKKPKKIPTAAENRIAVAAAGTETTTGHAVPGEIELIRLITPTEPPIPNSKPINPPSTDSTTASIKN